MNPASAAPAAAPPLQLGLPVPKLIYDAFEEVFAANARRFAKEIAKTLNQPDAPLLEALFKGPASQVRPYLFEESAEDKEVDLRCDYICQRPEAPLFLQPCCAPVLWTASSPNTHRCPQHLYSKPLASTMLRTLPVLVPLEAGGLDAEEAPLYRSEDGTVYDRQFQVRGRYDFPTKSLRLFEVEAEEEE